MKEGNTFRELDGLQVNQRDVDRIKKAILPYIPKLKPGDRALDIGAGSETRQYLPSGRGGFWDEHFTSLDLSACMLSLNDILNRVVASATNLPFRNNTFSLVTSFFLMRYLPDLEIMINEIARVTQNNARILLVDYLTSPNSGDETSYPISPDVVCRLLAPKFHHPFALQIAPSQRRWSLFCSSFTVGPLTLFTALRRGKP